MVHLSGGGGGGGGGANRKRWQVMYLTILSPLVHDTDCRTQHENQCLRSGFHNFHMFNKLDHKLIENSSQQDLVMLFCSGSSSLTVIVIIPYIYKASFLTGAHSVLQLLTTFTMTKCISATDASSHAYITCLSLSLSHTHSNQNLVGKR